MKTSEAISRPTVPESDNDLLTWSANLGAKLLSDGKGMGAQPGMAEKFDRLHQAFAAARAKAIDPLTRGPETVALMRLSAAALRLYARRVLGVMRTAGTLDEVRRFDLQFALVHMPKLEMPLPRTPPTVTVEGIKDYSVTIRMANVEVPERRRKKYGSKGKMVYYAVGAHPPEYDAGWTFYGKVFAPVCALREFYDAPPGATVWVKACWFDATGVGRTCRPVKAQLKPKDGRPSMVPSYTLAEAEAICDERYSQAA